jgi:hypothetical protein
MGYSERFSPTVNLGCLPASIFGFFVGAPAVFGTLMAECQDEGGGVGNCPNEGPMLLAIVAVTASLCLLITWATNRMVRRLAEQGRHAAWGVAAGFALATCLVGLLYALLLVI